MPRLRKLKSTVSVCKNRTQVNTIGAAKHSVVFSNKRAWLIVKPMKKVLDVKFYTTEDIDDALIFKSTFYYGKYAHHIRVDQETQITPQFFDLIRLGFDFAMR